MIKSMTGYGYNEFVWENIKFYVNIKSVNSRFFDIKINLPQELLHIESKVVALINEVVLRGKVEFNLWFEQVEDNKPKIEINFSLLEEYLKTVKYVIDRYKLQSTLNIMDILKEDEIIKVKYKRERISYNDTIEKGIVLAIERLNNMRIQEGKALYKGFISILNDIKDNLKVVKKSVPLILNQYESKIRKKVFNLMEVKKIDENRILMEVALLADKIDINEELERMDSHISQMKDYLKSNEPSGRQMEFLLQEILREVNTIGSKVSDVKITNIVIKIKDYIEKMKEQVRNVE